MNYNKKTVYLDSSTQDAVAELQQARPLPTISAVIRELLSEYVRPMRGSDRARLFLKESGGDFSIANDLMLQYLHGKYKDFNSKRKGPHLREYNRIRRTLHYVRQGKA